MTKQEIKNIFQKSDKFLNKEIAVEGWVKFNRNNGKICFLEINDGTTIKNLQIVNKSDFLPNFKEIISFQLASAIKVKGQLVLNNLNNEPELQAKEVKLLKLASCDYPLQNKEHSPEFLREIAHLRVRTTTTQAIMKIRNELTFSIHNFFHSNNFVYIATPIITSNDCEGAGENFVIKNDQQSNPFFTNNPVNLTVSGQLNAESYALGLKKVYTFGPTFRAERSHTNRHLAEFWMVEPELAFCNLKQLMNLIEKMFKKIINDVLKKCQLELNFLDKKFNNTNYENLKQITKNKFIRLEYSEAVKILQQAINNGHQFVDNNIFFGKDFGSEHEKYLCENHFHAPIFLINFPKEIKAFYMKTNKDGKTVAACDLLVPQIGEIIGGSQREDNYEKIVTRCHELNINTEPLKWYLDLRKYGYYQSAGFGLGLERILLYITGAKNIRDVIPFPRVEGKLSF